MPATTAETLSLVSRNVSVAPLVLLSAADHFGRSGKGLRKRVVGVLLGQNDGKNVRVSNSFAGTFNKLCWIQRGRANNSGEFSTLRRRRERSISMVLGSQLRRGHERHVQESKCPGKADRMVSFRAQIKGVRS